MAKTLHLQESQVCRFLNVAKVLESRYPGGVQCALSELRVLPKPGMLQVSTKAGTSHKDDVVIVALGGQLDLNLLMSRLAELSLKQKTKDTK